MYQIYHHFTTKAYILSGLNGAMKTYKRGCYLNIYKVIWVCEPLFFYLKGKGKDGLIWVQRAVEIMRRRTKNS